MQTKRIAIPSLVYYNGIQHKIEILCKLTNP